MKAVYDSFGIDAALHNLKGMDVVQVYEGLVRHAAMNTRLRESYMLARLIEQERRATSGIGNGVAIPHLRLRKLTRPFTLLARLSRPVDFNAVDRAPVDLVLLLLSPDTDVAAHLQRLSRFSRLMRDQSLCGALRDMSGADGMAALMLGAQQDLRRAA